MYNQDLIKLGEEDIWIVESNLGEKVILENGDEIWLDAPMYEFEVEDNLLERIVLGLDDVDMTLKYKNDIKLFEDLRKKEKPWIYADE